MSTTLRETGHSGDTHGLEASLLASPPRPQLDTARGQAVYSPLVLHAYDFWVLNLSCRWAWRCPSPVLLEQYDRHVGASHLDVGVGSGYFLDRCKFPVSSPRLVLCDLNPASLAFAARRVRRYAPVRVLHDVMQPFTLPERFDSIGLGFLLHCLPGNMADKARALSNVAELLKPGGVVFGSTILGQGVAHEAFGRRLLRLYNRKGIFGNANDSLPELERALQANLSDVQIELCGVVARFSARRRAGCASAAANDAAASATSPSSTTVTRRPASSQVCSVSGSEKS